MGQVDFPLPGHVCNEKCVCEKDGMGDLSPCLHCDQREWHKGPAATVMGNAEWKEGNGRKYITFAGATSTETCGLLSWSRIKFLI